MRSRPFSQRLRQPGTSRGSAPGRPSRRSPHGHFLELAASLCRVHHHDGLGQLVLQALAVRVPEDPQESLESGEQRRGVATEPLERHPVAERFSVQPNDAHVQQALSGCPTPQEPCEEGEVQAGPPESEPELVEQARDRAPEAFLLFGLELGPGFAQPLFEILLPLPE